MAVSRDPSRNRNIRTKPSYKGYTPSEYNQVLSDYNKGKPISISPKTVTVSAPKSQTNTITPKVSVTKVSNSNIGLGISPVISAESILANISTSRSTRSSPKTSIYTTFDNWLGGYLPGGVTPTEARTNKLTKKTQGTIALIEATNANNIQKQMLQDVKNQSKLKDDEMKRAMQFALKEQERAYDIREKESQARYDEQADQWTNSWYENLGLWNSAQEQAFQKQLSLQTLGQLLPSVNPTIDTGNGTQPFVFEEVTESESFLDKAKNYGIVALIAVAGVLLLPQLLKK